MSKWGVRYTLERGRDKFLCIRKRTIDWTASLVSVNLTRCLTVSHSHIIHTPTPGNFGFRQIWTQHQMLGRRPTLHSPSMWWVVRGGSNLKRLIYWKVNVSLYFVIEPGVFLIFEVPVRALCGFPSCVKASHFRFKVHSSGPVVLFTIDSNKGTQLQNFQLEVGHKVTHPRYLSPSLDPPMLLGLGWVSNSVFQLWGYCWHPVQFLLYSAAVWGRTELGWWVLWCRDYVVCPERRLSKIIL